MNRDYFFVQIVLNIVYCLILNGTERSRFKLLSKPTEFFFTTPSKIVYNHSLFLHFIILNKLSETKHTITESDNVSEMFYKYIFKKQTFN